MVSDRLEIRIDVDDTNVIAKYDEAKMFAREVDKTAEEWQRVKMTILSESRRMLYTMNGLISLGRHIWQQFGVSIGAMGDALLNIMQAVIQSIIAMQYAYAAGGPAGWAFIGVSIVSLGFAIDAQFKAAAGIEDAKESSRAAVAALGDIQSILTPWRF